MTDDELATAIAAAFDFDTHVDWADKLKAARIAIAITTSEVLNRQGRSYKDAAKKLKRLDWKKT